MARHGTVKCAFSTHLWRIFCEQTDEEKCKKHNKMHTHTYKQTHTTDSTLKVPIVLQLLGKNPYYFKYFSLEKFHSLGISLSKVTFSVKIISILNVIRTLSYWRPDMNTAWSSQVYILHYTSRTEGKPYLQHAMGYCTASVSRSAVNIKTASRSIYLMLNKCHENRKTTQTSLSPNSTPIKYT